MKKTLLFASLVILASCGTDDSALKEKELELKEKELELKEREMELQASQTESEPVEKEAKKTIQKQSESDDELSDIARQAMEGDVEEDYSILGKWTFYSTRDPQKMRTTMVFMENGTFKSFDKGGKEQTGNYEYDAKHHMLTFVDERYDRRESINVIFESSNKAKMESVVATNPAVFDRMERIK